jgi:hypothetical protein
MPYVPPRRTTSTATTITVNSSSLAWLPTKGSWGAVSLNTAESIKGDFGPAFPSSRNLGSLFNDFSGAVWNPYIGTYGAMLFHGGGHSGSGPYNGGGNPPYTPMLENSVYMWRADTREWSRLTDPMYPGTVAQFGPYDWGWSVLRTIDDLTEADEPLKTYGELRTNVPASNHSRWLLGILPPTNGGGSAGSLVLPNLSAVHITGAGSSGQMHVLNCATALAAGSANGYTGWSRLGSINSDNRRGWAGCVDTFNGYIYVSNAGFPSTYALNRYNIGAGTWSTTNPTGWSIGSDAALPIVYALTHHIMVLMRTDFTLRVINADATPMTIATATTAGSAPTGGAPGSGSGGGTCWCPDLGSYGAIVHYNYVTHEVKACYAPSNPLGGGMWTWATLSSSNTPVGRGNAEHWYNRFQYAPALKSFFLCSMPNDSYGGIVCFRPSEIP